MIEQFDAVVVGGGPAGSTAALMLARAGWQVAVFEKAAFPRRKVCGEYVSATNLPLFRKLGIAEEFLQAAGPPVRQVGLFANRNVFHADMPRSRDGEYGRALSREVLDTLLLTRAAAAGATVRQPWAITHFQREKDGWICRAVKKESRETTTIRTRIIIAAHGSWDPGNLPTQLAKPVARPSDLFGFKAHFRDCSLPVGLMPLVVFPGGYGGMVHTDGGRVSLSCCIRRDALARCRRSASHPSAGGAVLAHIQRSNQAVREATRSAEREGDWLSAGPIRPGLRACFSERVFLVGNAAGEAHPIIAEGISMAMQSAWLLCERLADEPRKNLSDEKLRAIRHAYEAGWRRSFVSRIRAASCFACLATQPAACALVWPVIEGFPVLLHWATCLSGKRKLLAGLS